MAGGVAGAALGAGTGALVAHEAGSGALVGGAIGVPVGVAVGIGVHEYQKDAELRDNRNRIVKGAEDLAEQQRELDRTREDLNRDSETLRPSDGLAEPLYDGPTVGQYRR